MAEFFKLFNFIPVVLLDGLKLEFDGVTSVVSGINSVVSFSEIEHLRLVIVTLLCTSHVYQTRTEKHYTRCLKV